MTQMRLLQFWAKRLARGLVAVFTLKMMLIAGAIALESCESKEDEYKTLQNEEALAAFEAVVKTTTPRIGKLMEKFPEALSEKGSLNGEKGMALEREIRQVLIPMVDGTKILLKGYNVEESYLQAEFQDSNDPRIALVGLMILAAERQEGEAVALNFAQAFGALGYAQQETTLEEAKKDWVDCLIVAVGIDVVVDFLKGNITEALAKKAIKKIASRTLGVVGAAIAAYEFGSCMGWY